MAQARSVRTYVEHVQNICHIELANSLTKCTLLIIEQIQDVFNTSKNKSSSPSFEAMQICPRKSSEEVLFIKTRQIARPMYLLRFNSSKLNRQFDSCIYQGLRNSNFQIYFSRISKLFVQGFFFFFLTTLNIYKNYFKDHLR